MAFEVARTRGMVRILTLSTSSTISYYHRDDETYPYYLERAALLMTKVEELQLKCLERRGVPGAARARPIPPPTMATSNSKATPRLTLSIHSARAILGSLRRSWFARRA